MPPASRKTVKSKKKIIVSPAKKKTRALVKSKAPKQAKEKSKKGQALKAWWDEKKRKSAGHTPGPTTEERVLKVAVDRLESPKTAENPFETSEQCELLITEIKEEEVHIDDVHQENEQTNGQVPIGYLPSELLPGPKGEVLYYDGGGFYYRQTFEDDSQRWLHCIHNECGVEAHMELYERAPIILREDEKHSHKPNTSRRDRMWFLHHLTSRNRAEDTPFSVIFQEEAAKNPVGASFFTLEKIEKHLQKKKKSSGESAGGELNIAEVHSEAGEFNPKFLWQESPNKPTETPQRPKGLLKRKLPLESKKSKRNKIDDSLSQETCETPAVPDINDQDEESNQKLCLPSDSPVGTNVFKDDWCDEKGYHYFSYGANKDARYLRCVVKECRVDARMGLPLNSEIRLIGKKKHNHPPQGTGATLNPSLSTESSQSTSATSTPPESRALKPASPYVTRKSSGRKYTLNIPSEELPPLVPIARKDPSSTPIARKDSPQTSTAGVPPLTPIAGMTLLPNILVPGASAKSSVTRKVSPTIKKNLTEQQKPATSASSPLTMTVSSSSLQSLAAPLGFVNPIPGNMGSKTTMPSVLLVPMTLNPNNMSLTPVVMGPGAMNLGQVAVNPGPMGVHFVSNSNVASQAAASSRNIQKCSDENQTLPISNTALDKTSDSQSPINKEIARRYPPRAKKEPLRLTEPAKAHNCRECDGPIVDLRKQIVCLTGCKKPYHVGCTQVRAENIKKNKEKGSDWKCDSCRDLAPQDSVAVPRTSQSSLSDTQVLPLNASPVLPTSTGAEPILPILTTTEPISPNQLAKLTSTTRMILPKTDVDPSTSVMQKVYRADESETVPGFLSDSWLYHDVKGHYYVSRGVHKHKRLLACAHPMCSVRAWMHLTAGAVIHPLSSHLHPPCPPLHQVRLWLTHRFRSLVQQGAHTARKSLETLYSEQVKKDPSIGSVVPFREMVKILEVSGLKGPAEICQEGKSATRTSTKLAECIPSSTFGGVAQYYDGEGFYYTIERFEKRTKNRYLRCATSPLCPGRGVMGLKSPITMTAAHNHERNRELRDIYVFIDTLKTRVRNDLLTSVSNIYSQEARRYPRAAEKMDEESVIDKLLLIRNSLLTPEVMKLNVYFGGDESLEEQYNGFAETLQGCRAPVYYDGKGFYYIETFSDPLTRYLMCCEPNCLAQAQMNLTDQDSIFPLPSSELHNHRADFYRYELFEMMKNVYRRFNPSSSQTILYHFSQEAQKYPIVAAQVTKRQFTQMIKSEFKKPPRDDREDIESEGIWEADYQVERLPNFKTRDWTYYDGKGYHYYRHQYNKDTRSLFLICCTEGCGATASMSVDKFPETISRQPGCLLHNHGPDLGKTQLLRFLRRVMTRVQRENHFLPTEIFQQEVNSSQKEVSDVISRLPYEKCLEIMSQLAVTKFFQESQPDFNELNEDKGVPDVKLPAGEWKTEQCLMLWSHEPRHQVYCLDPMGFYYIEVKTVNTERYLKCMVPLCKAVAMTTVSTFRQIKIPVLSPSHNHPPDFEYKNRLVMINRMRDMAISTSHPIDSIFSQTYKQYEQELGGNTERFNSIDEINMKNMMYKARKARHLEIPEEEAVGSFNRPNADEEMKSKEKNDDFYSYFEELEKLFYEHGYKPTAFDTTAADEPEDMVPEKPQRVRTVKEPKKQTAKENPLIQRKIESPRLPVKILPKDPALKIQQYYTTDKDLKENSTVKDIQENSNSTPKTAKASQGVSLLKQHEASVIPEKIPYRFDKVIYFDPRGYYFLPTTVNQEHTLYLHCIQSSCRVWAWISKKIDNARMVMADDRVIHNHKPDFLERKKLMFEHRIMQHALSNENHSLDDIWRVEAERDPDTAKELSYAVRMRLSKYRYEHFKEKWKKERTPAKQFEATLFQELEERPTRVDLDDEPRRVAPSKTGRLNKGEKSESVQNVGVPDGTNPYLAKSKSKSKLDTKETQDNLAANQTLNDAAVDETQDLNQSQGVKQYERKVPPNSEGTLKSPRSYINTEPQKKKLRKCSFVGCEVTNVNSPETHMFGFPVIRPQVCEEWIENCANKHLLDLSQSVLQWRKVCSNHFTSDCFTNGLRNFLKRDAIPTLLNHNSVVEKETSEDETPLASRVSRRKVVNPMKKKLVERAKAWNRARLEMLVRRKKEQKTEELTSESSKETPRTPEVRQSSSTSSPKTKKNIIGPKGVVADEKSDEDEESDDSSSATETSSATAKANDWLAEDWNDLKNRNEQRKNESKENSDNSESSTPVLKATKSTTKKAHKVTKKKDLENSSVKSSTPRPKQSIGPKIGPKSVVAGEESEEGKESDEENYVVESLDDDYTDYVTLEDSEDNVTSQEDGLSYRCHHCGNCFSSSAVLLAHVRERHLYKEENEKLSQTTHKCDQCHRVFQSKRFLFFHKSRASKDCVPHTSTSKEQLPPDSKEETSPSSNEQEISQEEEVKSERVPSFRANGVVFYDGKGYYYTTDVVQDNKRHLKCVDKTCEGTAVMDNYEGAPIVITDTSHSHEPNPTRQKYYRFLKRCCDRAVAEKRPVIDIYKQEADKDPQGAPQPLKDTVISRMVLARNSALRNQVKTAELKKKKNQRYNPQTTTETSENEQLENEADEESPNT